MEMPSLLPLLGLTGQKNNHHTRIRWESNSSWTRYIPQLPKRLRQSYHKKGATRPLVQEGTFYIANESCSMQVTTVPPFLLYLYWVIIAISVRLPSFDLEVIGSCYLTFLIKHQISNE